MLALLLLFACPMNSDLRTAAAAAVAQRAMTLDNERFPTASPTSAEAEAFMEEEGGELMSHFDRYLMVSDNTHVMPYIY